MGDDEGSTPAEQRGQAAPAVFGRDVLAVVVEAVGEAGPGLLVEIPLGQVFTQRLAGHFVERVPGKFLARRGDDAAALAQLPVGVPVVQGRQ